MTNCDCAFRGASTSEWTCTGPCSKLARLPAAALLAAALRLLRCLLGRPRAVLRLCRCQASALSLRQRGSHARAPSTEPRPRQRLRYWRANRGRVLSTGHRRQRRLRQAAEVRRRADRKHIAPRLSKARARVRKTIAPFYVFSFSFFPASVVFPTVCNEGCASIWRYVFRVEFLNRFWETDMSSDGSKLRGFICKYTHVSRARIYQVEAISLPYARAENTTCA